MSIEQFKAAERETIILPMDGLSKDEALEITDELKDGIWGVKIHHQYDTHGAGLTREFKERTSRVMADLKLHDIPETVKKRGMEYVKEGADYLTLHASGGVAMMQMLAETIEQNPNYRTQLLAISVLTSLKANACVRSYGDLPPEKVREFALMAVEAGVPGLVLSSEEVALVDGNKLTKNLIKVVPGIRMPGAAKQDQERVGGPYSTIKAGANQLVIGRPILNPETGSRRDAMEMFVAEIARAWAEIKHEESEKFLKKFAAVKALWLDREMVSPVHAKLASGLHSNAFFNTTKVIENPRLLEEAIKSRSLNLQKYGRVDWVVGSAMGGITIAHEVARTLGARAAFTEKMEMLDAREREPLVNFMNAVKNGQSIEEIPKEIVQILARLEKMTDSEKMILKRFEDVKAGDRVLLCEDVIMTGGTTAATMRLLKEKGCEVIPEVVAVCDRSDRNSERFALGETQINSLIQLQLPTHEPDNCEMCKKGSVADSVKARWSELKHS